MSDYKNPLWPNGLQKDDEGYTVFYPLGTNKVDITTITWPDGDKLISPFVYKNNKLVGFVDTKAMTVSGSAATTMNYNHIEADFSSIEEGTLAVDAPNAVVKEFRWSVVDNGDDTIVLGTKYIDCTTSEEVRGVDWDYHINDIKDGVWSESLANLTTAQFLWPLGGEGCPSEFLFENCDNLIIFNSDLSSLTDGHSMFRECNNLTSFNANLSKLVNGEYMFTGCGNLTDFNPENLDLIEYTNSMLDGCRLNATSVKNLIDLIHKRLDSYNGWGIEITIGMGCDPTESDMDAFAKECGYDDMGILSDTLNPGMRVHCSFQLNGRPSSSYSLRKPVEDRLPIYVKLSEIEENQNSYYNYTSLDGTKKYRLNWFHKTSGSTDGYTQFNTLEEAEQYFNIKPVERN